MGTDEKLANEIYALLEKPISSNCLRSANIHASSGDWSLVGRAFLCEALERGTYIPTHLAERALSKWGRQEFGAAYDEFDKAWVRQSVAA